MILNVCSAEHNKNIQYLFLRYLYHSNSNPELAFESSKILHSISCNVNIQAKLVGDFTQDQVSLAAILACHFYMCLWTGKRKIFFIKWQLSDFWRVKNIFLVACIFPKCLKG